MFPEMDSEVIEAVLRAHGGEVDATIDHLLAMNTSETEKSLPKAKEPPMEDLIQLGPSLNIQETILDPLKIEKDSCSKAVLAYSHPERASDEDNTQTKVSVVPTPQMLQNRYEENLRNRERVRTTGIVNEPSLSQYLEDERVALMLQNEEFMAELRRDHEFISALENENASPATLTSSSTNSYSLSPKTSKLSMDEAIFREKLKNMGKTSKKVFSISFNV
ncbi:CUE domain-containing protein 1-like [Lepeophtheirus salmonis]|uniref:CUE domain-containing protein 1-like n=1 Tax=Lepeophtheirus salmonis TaxID=72036 RepID=UPI003AF3D35B